MSGHAHAFGAVIGDAAEPSPFIDAQVSPLALPRRRGLANTRDRIGGDTNDAADPTFYEGDYDQDGDTDGDDVNLFLIDFNAGGGLPRDLGVSAQPPLWPEHRVAPLP